MHADTLAALVQHIGLFAIKGPVLVTPLIVTLFLMVSSPTLAAAVDGAVALRQLLAGNQRYVQGNLSNPHQQPARRADLTQGQQPIAVILGCSDSRVPPEIVFDQGLGDLFVVRLAGNVADPVAIDSIVYAVQHLGTRLIMVLGHDACGAVTAAVQAQGDSQEFAALLDQLAPAVKASAGQSGDRVSNAINDNVRLTVAKLSKAPPLAAMASGGELKIVGARYHLDSGQVEILTP